MVASYSLARGLAENKLTTIKHLITYGLSSSGENIIGETRIISDTDPKTDRQAGLSLAAESIVAPVEGRKTSKAGTFRALGRDAYILKLYSFSCAVMSSRTVQLNRQVHTLLMTVRM